MVRGGHHQTYRTGWTTGSLCCRRCVHGKSLWGRNVLWDSLSLQPGWEVLGQLPLTRPKCLYRLLLFINTGAGNGNPLSISQFLNTHCQCLHLSQTHSTQLENWHRSADHTFSNTVLEYFKASLRHSFISHINSICITNGKDLGKKTHHNTTNTPTISSSVTP